MKQKRQDAPKGQPQRITNAVTHIHLLEVNPGKLTALDTLAPVYSAGTPHEGSFTPVFTSEVSGTQAQAPKALDHELLCQYGRGSVALSHQAAYRESKACLA